MLPLLRLAITSVVVALTVALDITAFSAAPVPEESQLARQALMTESLARLAGSDPEELGNSAFRLEDWLGDNGSGGFPANFSDEHRRHDPWEEQAQ
jgi:hypothetical protein